MKATIKDVAKHAGVSFKTVSRVVNREPGVGEDMQARVWEAIKALDYHPNLSARQLRGAPTFIAFIYDNPNSHYVIEMQHGLLSECHRQGFELLIHPVDANSGTVTEELEQLVRNSHIAGLVLTPPFSEDSELIQSLSDQGAQFVRILSASAAPDELGPCVYIDDYQASYEITNYLIGLGHRSIAFLGGELHHRSSIERLNGYLAALQENGISRSDELILAGEYNFDSGAERTRHLLATRQQPTAIFACNDEIAAGALFAARINQVAVPQQLSIVGFEDSPFSRQSWPKLTTAHQPNTSIAECAADLLISTVKAARLGKEASDLPENGFLPALVVRDSTCPAPV